MRIRLRYTTDPIPAVELTDTPHPKCLLCHGKGGWEQDRANGRTEQITCDCWHPERAWFVVAVPQWLARAVAR